MDTALLMFIYLAVGIYEFYPLYREGRWKQGMIYLGLFSISFIMSLLLSIGVKIPSPAGPIEDVVQKITGIF